jgi:hypothetical protein
MQHKELLGWKAALASQFTRFIVLLAALGWIGALGAWGQGRVVSAVGPSLGAGQNGTVAITLAAQGDENAVGFSLTFDPAKLTYVSTVRGADASGTSLQLNASQAASGRVGVALSLDPEVTFPAGARQLIVMTFTAKTGAGFGATPIGFGDTPVTSEVSDALANKVTATFTGGTVTVLNTAPTISDVQNVSALEEQTIVVNFTVGDLETPVDSLTVTRATSNAEVVALSGLVLSGTGANRALQITPVLNANGTATITLTVSDGTGGLTASDTFVLTVVAVNDAPSFTKGADVTVLEDSAAYSAVWATAISSGPPDEATQTLTFSVSNNNSALFSTPPAISANGTLTFTPAPNASGMATVTVTLQDTGGTANGGQDTSAEQTFTINVTAVNDAPSFTKGADVTVLEDSAAYSAAWATAMSAGPADESGQTLTFNVSNSNNALFSAQPAIAANGTLAFTPAPNASGTATVTVTLSDNGGTANGGQDTSAAHTFSISVTAVNDAPSFTKGADVTVLEDSAAYSALWATAISAGPADESGQTLTFEVSNDASSLFSVQPAIDSNGTLSFTPAADAFGSATVTVVLRDNGGTANGGADATAPLSFGIHVTAVNDRPTVSEIRDTTTRINTPKLITFTVGDVDDDPALLNVIATSGNTAIVANSGISTGGSGANRTITLTPVTDALGSTEITVTVSDGDLTIDEKFLLTVNLNALPTITGLPANATINEDGSVGPLAFIVADSDGTVGVPTVVSDNATLLPAGSLLLNGSGANWSLTITPAANQHGTANVTVSVTDNEGAVGTESLVLTVNSVNDAPSFTKGANQTVNEDAGAQTITAWATGISAGPPEESGQTLTFEVSNGNNALFSAQPAIASIGTLTFTPAANAFGTATVTVVLRDNGGTANGGVDATAPQTFTITVNSVNDAPSFTAGPDITLDEDAGAQTVANWATDLSVGPANEADQTLAFELTNNNNPLFSAQPAIAANGTLTFTPAANAFGTATVTVLLRDSGGTANGGVNVSAPHALTITVNSVNDAPVFVDLADEVETSKNRSVQMTFSVSDVETSAADLEVAVVCSDATLVAPAGLVLTHTGGGAYTLDITPEADQFRTATLTFTVKDGDNLEITQDVELIVNENNPPTIAAIANQTTPEDIPTALLPVTIGDVETAASDLGLTAVSSNPAVLDAAGIALGGSGTARTLRLTPKLHQSGTTTITLRVTDGEGAFTETSFVLTVTAVNDAPTIAAITNKTTPEDTTLEVALTLGDVDNDPATLVVAATSLNTTLVPNTGLSVTGSGANRTLRIVPALNQHGTARIRVTVSDGSLSTPTEFTLTVTPVDDPPTISAMADRTTMKNQQLLVNFVVGDVDTPLSTLRLSGTFLPTEPVQGFLIGFMGAESSRTLVYTPPTGVTGRAGIRVTVSDATTAVSTTFVVTIQGENEPPTISAIADRSVEVGTPVGLIAFTVGDAETAPAALGVVATSDNSRLLPPGSLVLGGGNESRTLAVTPASGETGAATVTVTVTDADAGVATESFVLTVVPKIEPPVNTPPQITGIANQSIRRDTVAGPLDFLVADDETPSDLLVVTGASSNTSLVPAIGVVLNGTGFARTVTIRPAAGQVGTTVITLTVTDADAASTFTQFSVTVTAPPPVEPGTGAPWTLHFQHDDGFLAWWNLTGLNRTSDGFTSPNHPGMGWGVQATGDLNGDGREDLIFQYPDGTLAAWLMNGSTRISHDVLSPASPGDAHWHLVAAADFNGDGRADLIFQRPEGRLAVWYMNGFVRAGDSLLVPEYVELGWQAVAAGDINGDGQADLVFQHETGALGVWYMMGATRIGSDLLTPTFPSDPAMRVVALAQVDGAAGLDLVFRSPDSTLSVWYMNGPVRIGGGLLNPAVPGTVWHVVGPK